jgi:hypothetical protein
MPSQPTAGCVGVGLDVTPCSRPTSSTSSSSHHGAWIQHYTLTVLAVLTVLTVLIDCTWGRLGATTVDALSTLVV